jgi:hypothetical protein
MSTTKLDPHKGSIPKFVRLAEEDKPDFESFRIAVFYNLCETIPVKYNQVF